METRRTGRRLFFVLITKSQTRKICFFAFERKTRRSSEWSELDHLPVGAALEIKRAKICTCYPNTRSILALSISCLPSTGKWRRGGATGTNNVHKSRPKQNAINQIHPLLSAPAQCSVDLARYFRCSTCSNISPRTSHYVSAHLFYSKYPCNSVTK